MNRPVLLRSAQIAIDLAVLSGALWLALVLRLEGDVPWQMFKRLFLLWPYIVGLQYVLLVAMGIPRFSWRHVGLREAMRILRALAMSSAVLIAARFFAPHLLAGKGYAFYAQLPLGVVVFDFALAFLGLSGVRVTRRLFTERAEAQRSASHALPRVPTLLVGAGHAGLLIAKEVARRP